METTRKMKFAPRKSRVALLITRSITLRIVFKQDIDLHSLFCN